MVTYKTNLKNKRIFISGGAGVIGSALVKKLSKLGCKIFVGDLKPKPKNFSEDIIYRQGDLNNITKEEIREFQPEYFFHLAATFERTEESFGFWNENFSNNIQLSHYLMSILMKQHSLKKVIFASSYLIYEPNLYTTKTKPIKPQKLKEEEIIYPRNTCGAAKLFHEIELRFLQNFEEIKFDVISARIFRVYGQNSNDVISRWIRNLLKGEEISVYNKENCFDYIFAEDVAEGLTKLLDSSIIGVVNLGNGRARSIQEVLEILKKHFPKMKIKYQDHCHPYEASEADMQKFKKNTGWMPTKQLEDNIPKIIEFEKNRQIKNYDKTYEFNILVTSISKKISLLKAIKKANEKLGNTGKIIGADSNAQCIGKYFVDRFWKMPTYKKLTIKEVIEFCSKNNISCIIPTSDGELTYYAKYKKELLKKNIHVMVSDLKNISYCLDKLEFFNKIKSLKFPSIKTSDNINNIKAEYYVVKERFANFGTQLNKIKVTKEEAQKISNEFENPIFQPFINGDEYSIDLYIDKKRKVKGCIVRSRDMIQNGESQITTSVEDKKIEGICKKLVEKLNLFGHVVVQIIKDKKNNIYILECNNRFGGASSLSLELGLETFYWFLLETVGSDLKDYQFIRSEIQKKQIRYPEDLILF